MSRIILVTEFEVRAKDMELFVAAAREQAIASHHSEPGCESFEVATDHEEADHGVLIEVYQDEAAVQAHRETPHFATFFEAIKDIDVRWKSGVYDLPA
jgi:quinol monooxygenase YgiN